jgi:heme/copper-type cytochrome/quinol oxidase subunit 2
MLGNTTTPLNQNRPLQNLAVLAAVTTAVALFIITISNSGLLRIGSPAEIAPTPGSLILQIEEFKFVQQELSIPAGTEIQLALSNNDILPHSFDVDELNLHLDMPAKESAETLVTFSQSGTYTFYCAIPGHRAAGMVGTLIVE